ncbi:MAG: kinase/pyrophosphorylase [Gemmatimonadetes bacterium]|nr:kinase/pyrophosphorylase [Gemmatimonadota bacterium]
MVVYVLSDALGETAEAVARAGASQFDDGETEFFRVAYANDRAAVLRALTDAKRRNGVLVFTLVDPELRSFVRSEAGRLDLATVDVLGPVLDAFSRVTPKPPRLMPGLSHRLDAEYFRRVDAIEFAVKYDDGRNPSGLGNADVVLVGVSRCSKTPVSMYLARRGYKVANVPLVPELDPPPELERIDKDRIVGFTVRADKLRQIREERLRTLDVEVGSGYADPSRIAEEIRFANRVFMRLGCAVIDVTYKAVEETAREVLEVLGEEES